LIKEIKYNPTTNRPLTDPSPPFFRLGWCGSDNPSLRRTFHSIRRSGGFLFLFSYRKRKIQPFIVSDATVGFIRICLLFFKGSHGLGEEPRLGPFFAKEKGKPDAAPDGYRDRSCSPLR
jgi:hypothetical protein